MKSILRVFNEIAAVGVGFHAGLMGATVAGKATALLLGGAATPVVGVPLVAVAAVLATGFVVGGAIGYVTTKDWLQRWQDSSPAGPIWSDPAEHAPARPRPASPHL